MDVEASAVVNRYVHAADDAPLYRVPKDAGGQVWPAVSASGSQVCLDMAGYLVWLHQDDVALIARPADLPDWAIDLVVRVLKFEDEHPNTKYGTEGDCFATQLEAIPAETMEFIRAWARKP